MAKTCRACGREFAGSETYCPDDGFRLSSIAEPSAVVGGDPLLGVTLDGRYRILRSIGEGGMGVVYEALHVVIEKPVAVKVLRETFTSRPDVVERFRQEAKSASRIGHPNIIDVSDFGETPSGASYIVMEMLTGEDLADILSRERVLAPARAVRIVYQVARALDATHKKGIVHRDLKPENIYLITVDGATDVVKVVDFGVAKMSDLDNATGRRLTRTGMLFGTPEYMSPEQAAGKAFDHRVDIYALGAIFFELLTGRVPFEGENFMEVLSKHGRDAVPALQDVNPGTRVSPELEQIVARALAKDPADRFLTMADLANELRAAPEMPGQSGGDPVSVPDWALVIPSPPSAANTPSTAPVETPTSLAHPRFGRGGFKAALWLASAGILLLAGTGLIVSRSSGPAEAAPTQSALASQQQAASSPPASAPADPAAPAAPAAPAEASEPAPSGVLLELPDSSAPARQASSVRPTAAPSESAPGAMEAKRVELLVRTEPAGARIKVLGKDAADQQCRETPCSLSLPRGQSVQLRATLGRSTIKRRVSYDEDGELELRFASAARKPAEDRASAATPSDLKVPELFR